MTAEDRVRLEAAIGHRFREARWLELALTHPSARSIQTSTPGDDNDRLEFLGDRVIGLVVSEHLVRSYPSWDTGKLSKATSRLVSGASIRAAAEAINLGHYLLLGRGEERTGGRTKPSLLSDAFEALVAAIYLDGGFECAAAFVHRSLVSPGIHRAEGPLHISDHKSALQEWVQQHDRGSLTYHVRRESGPDHQKVFEVEAWLDGRRLAVSEGRSKKEAEQSAAHRALECLLGEADQR